MEIAIPFIALAGAYVISNQSSKKEKGVSENREKYGHGHGHGHGHGYAYPMNTRLQQGFENMGANKTNNPNELPNTNIPAQNYPITNYKELNDTTHHYSNPNSATDKYFNQNQYEKLQRDGKRIGNDIQDIYSLSGNYLKSKEFKHNNMVPFTGPKIGGYVHNVNMAETILDNMAGTGSQTIKKIEQAPLFKPQDNVQWPFGMPDQSDFYQSRVNPAMNNAMVKPFESIHVGPGLGKGFTSEGSGGYNSGMEDRKEWLPKTVDELRVETNPKMTYSLDNLEGPAYSHIQNVGILGKVEKYHPDTFYVNSQDRYLTTVGQEKGPMLRPVEEVHDTHRGDKSVSYSGVAVANNKTGSYTPTSFTESKRTQLPELDVKASYVGGGKGPSNADEYQRAYSHYENNRSTTRHDLNVGASFQGAIGAVIAPILDVFRPTRKEEYGSNIRVYGDGKSHVPGNYVASPGDVPAPTVKQTTIHRPNSYIGNQTNQGYVLHNQTPIHNNRETTNTDYTGIATNGQYGELQVDAAYRQTNNDKLEQVQVAYTPQGNMQLYNQQMNVTTIRSDAERENNRLWAPQATTISQMAASKEMLGKMTARQQYDESRIGCERIQPDILDAFRSNPYSFSLQSYANF